VGDSDTLPMPDLGKEVTYVQGVSKVSFGISITRLVAQNVSTKRFKYIK
jgi:hypothetical protein